MDVCDMRFCWPAHDDKEHFLERIWINRVASEIVFQPLRQDTAPVAFES